MIVESFNRFGGKLLGLQAQALFVLIFSDALGF